MMVDLYKRALGPSAVAIDLDSVDLREFRPAFRTTLKNLFKKHPEKLSHNPDQNLSKIDLFNQLSSSYLRQLELADLFITQTVHNNHSTQDLCENNIAVEDLLFIERSETWDLGNHPQRHP